MNIFYSFKYMYNLYQYMPMKEYQYELKIHDLEQQIDQSNKKIDLFNKFLIELLDKERLQKENVYLKEQLYKLSKNPRYKTF